MKRIELLVFVFAWFTYAYFHQGGGWNQNGRFALTRALVERHEPWIDDYLVYAANGPKGSPWLRRVPVRDGGFTDAGRTFALAWSTTGSARTPLAPNAPKDARLAPADWATVTGDLAFARGHTHPNKAPGVSLAAVPGYALVFGLERLFGVDTDAANVLNLNAWLSGLLSVGLISAWAVVLFMRLALRLAEGRTEAAVFATMAFAFGSLYFPYATMLYEHDLVAAFLLAAFFFSFEARNVRSLVAAGICAGAAVVSSYLAVVGLVILGGYIFWRGRRLSRVATYAAGAIPPLGVLAAYNLACFGTVLTTNYAWETPLFKQSAGGWSALFTVPRFDVLLALLVSPFRGLFSGTPVLVLGAIGLIAMLRQQRLRPEGVVCAAMIAYPLAFNVSFTNWNGGWACGPRYLILAIPFLALPIALPTRQPRFIRAVLLAVSIAGMALVTIVDPQPPSTSAATWTVSPIWNIDLPQLVHARPGSFASATFPSEYLAQRQGPVSVNPGGIYEATAGRFFAIDSPQARWSSFNAGEIVFPGSRLSVLPWLALASAFAVLLWRRGSDP